MNRLNCIIVDDEPVARKILKEFIEQVPNLQLAAEFENVAKTATYLSQQPADLLFLDIEMPGINGLDYLRKSAVQPLVIITTAYPEYALEGYELNVIDYLLKPISFERFQKSTQKAKDYMTIRTNVAADRTFPWIFVKSEKRIEKIDLDDIVYIESTGNYVKIHTKEKNILAYLTLKSVEQQLPQQDFIKIHQSYIVNLSSIQSIEGNQVKAGNVLLPVGRNYRETIVNLVERFIIRR